ncbi:MAG: FAD-dependent oxidoreductase [Candidatus Nitrotoga sp.]
MPRLILIGGGHAQLSVLRALATDQLEVEAVLVTPSEYQIYSGMLPGWVAGHYTMEECRIDLRPLALAASVRLILGSVVGIDAKRRVVELSDGSTLNYDALSIDVGSETDMSWLQATDERLLPIKPLNAFVQRWPDIVTSASQRSDYHLAIVGGGAAGVELAFAARYAFISKGIQAKVALVAPENGLLPGHAESVKKRAKNLLHHHGIRLHHAQAVGVAKGLQLDTGERLQADCIIATTGASPAAWLRNSGLARDEQGYLLVDAQQRSVSHANIFAAGDVCVREDIRLPRSGVHAVLAGPILANNLLSNLTGNALQRYRPRKKSLYLLATGSQYAIASWGRFSAQGHWVWRWKNWIDQRFMHKNRMGHEGGA